MRRGVVGANIGANKESADRIGDYVRGLEALWGRADYFTINVSSPNTPGLRALQTRGALEELLGRLLLARRDAQLGGAGCLRILLGARLRQHCARHGGANGQRGQQNAFHEILLKVPFR